MMIEIEPKLVNVHQGSTQHGPGTKGTARFTNC